MPAEASTLKLVSANGALEAAVSVYSTRSWSAAVDSFTNRARKSSVRRNLRKCGAVKPGRRALTYSSLAGRGSTLLICGSFRIALRYS